METTTITSAMIQLHRGSPDYSDLLHQINVYGGPSTDIDPLPGATPPMVATKSNTRVINVDVGDSEVEEYKRPPN